MSLKISLLLIIGAVDSSGSLKRPRFSLGEPPRRHPGVYFGGVKANGRVIEAYTSEHTIEHGDEIIGDLMSQVILDAENENFLPNLNSSGYQLTPLGNLSLGAPVYRGPRAVIFPVLDSPDMLIKYQCDCEGVVSPWSSMHPLLLDWIYGNRAAGHDLAVRTLFVSPPSRLCTGQTGVCGFTMTNQSFALCNASLGTLRFSIMERSRGITLDQYKSQLPRGIVPFKHAISIGIGMIELLERLHTKVGIVHGDIHTRNILIEPPTGYAGTSYTPRDVNLDDANFKRLRLIDFERAVKNIRKPNSPRNRCRVFFTVTCSQWQIDGFYTAARDDVMKAIQSMAELMNPYGYYKYGASRASEGYESMKHFKTRENIFVLPGFDPIENLEIPETRKNSIRYDLAIALDLARRMCDVNSIPPYREIIKTLQNCLSLL